jgi:predicted RecB family nuclease
MFQYTLAIADTDESAAARAWLLTYNQGDVAATLTIRDWMATAVASGVEDRRASGAP